MRCLLNHARVECITLRPTVLKLAVAVDKAGEEGIGGVGGRAGEFVEGKGEGDSA